MQSGKKGATGPRTEQGKARSSQNARKHGLSAATLLPGDDEAVEALFEEFQTELKLEGVVEVGIGRKLAYNEFRLRQITDYEAHRFEVADANGTLQAIDRPLRKHFEQVFLRGGSEDDSKSTPSRRLPANLAKRYLVNLKMRIESRGVQSSEDLKAVAYIYGKEMDAVGATIVCACIKFDRLANTAEAEMLEGQKLEIVRSIDFAIKMEDLRAQAQLAAENVEFADDAPALPPDAELERIHRFRTQYERQTNRLFNELRLIRRLKGGDD